MISDKPKKVMSPEMLEKLALARERALQVRQEKASKLNEIKTLEKQNKQKQIDDKLNELKNKVEVDHDPIMMPSTSVEPLIKKKKVKANNVKQKLEKLLDEESSDDSSDGDNDSDDDDLVKDYLKKKYKNKYQQKYSRKVDHMLMKGHTANYLKNRVSEDMIKIAQENLFS